MRTTVALDDELLRKARAFTALIEKSAIIREAFIARVLHFGGDTAVRQIVYAWMMTGYPSAS
jgi:hypothetical protein